jgi:hypothetical protein
MNLLSLATFIALACAIKVGVDLIKTDTSYAGTLPQFDGEVWSNQITLYFWVKPNTTLTSSQFVFKSMQANASVYSLERTSSQSFQACYGATCTTQTHSSTLYTWHFIGFELGSTLKLCVSEWAARTLSCSQVVVTVTHSALFGVDFSLSLYPGISEVRARQTELWDFNLETSVSLQSTADAYGCHAVCSSCFGPAFNACLDFFSLVELQESLSLTTTPKSFTVGDPAFQGRTYPTVSMLSFTGWMLLQNIQSPSDKCSVIRFSTNE